MPTRLHHPRTVILRACSLFLVSLLAACDGGSDSAPAPSYSATIAESRVAVQQALKDSGSASMSVALMDGDRVIWSEAFGVADTSTGKAPTTGTLYAIGSVSKVIAAIATMKLVDQGRVNLDDPLVDYLPTFSMLSPEYRDITVRMLLNHSSGFGGTDGRNGFMSAPFAGYAAQLLETLRGERLKHRPGYLSVYCNDGFTMLENLVKAVTGQSYPEFVQKEILAPLGMNSSRFPQIPGDLAQGTYADSKVNGVLITPEFTNLYATGGLYSTPSDMARLAMMLMNGGAIGSTRILSPESVAEMGKDQTTGTFNPQPSDFTRFGLGWDSVSQPGMKAVGVTAWYKSGGTLAYTTEFIVLPQEHLAVIVNTDHTGAKNSLKIAEQILLRALVERGRITAMPPPLTPTVLPEATTAAAEEEAISGLYAANGGLYRAGFAADHSLSIETYVGGVWQPKYTTLKLRTDGWYTSDTNPASSVYALTADNRRYLAVRGTLGYGHYLINLLNSQKLETRPAVNPQWGGRVGATYLLANPNIHDLALMGSGTDPRFTLRTLPELPGYLFTPGMDILDASVDAELARMFLLIPQNSGRDLSDLRVITRGTEEWLRSRSILFRPLSGVATLPARQSTVTIGSEGYVEWRKVLVPATGGTIAINNGDAWRLYDADFKPIASGLAGDSAVVLPGSSATAYLVLFGPPGAAINLYLVQ